MEIPRKILNNSILNCIVRVDKRKICHLLITKAGLFFEISKNSTSIKSVPLFEEELIDLLNVQINLQVYHSYVTYKPQTFYVIHLMELQKLVIVKRVDSKKCGGSESVELQTYKTFEKVVEFHIKSQVNDKDKSYNAVNNCTKVHILFESVSAPLITDFSEVDSDDKVVGLDDFMYEILQKARETTYEVKAKVASAKIENAELFKKASEELKFVPKELRSTDPGENAPLVQYGDCLYRTYNDQLVIGIPVINVTNDR